MAKRGLATAGSIALHGALIGLALLSWPSEDERQELKISSVPVSIVSDVEIAAAPADNPADEVVEAETVPDPAPTPPEPTPPEPTPAPRPTPTPARKTAPAPTPTPRPAEKARPTPPRPQPRPTPPRQETPPRKAAPREDPGLDLGSLAGPPRKAPPREATGDRGAGQAARATGAQITAIFNQVYPNWNIGPTCDVPGGNELRIVMDVTLSPTGRITSGPTLVSPRSDGVYRAAADEAIRALRRTAPFNVPSDFPGGAYRPTFNTERACANR
ncbi:hypothetical protein [Brevundimonas lutea]|uniref:hypothetical protein n=1 Tax=Brevundimonas lutea TaxID=2293980 RepID=UPI0013CEE3BA|nr:hypothetical protein [Brevundimonas lutea]